eukprot:7866949-Pyramimonas_sp.AAC.2
MGLGIWNQKRMGCINTWQTMFNHLPDQNGCTMVQQCRTPPPGGLMSAAQSEEDHSALFLGDGGS